MAVNGDQRRLMGLSRDQDEHAFAIISDVTHKSECGCLTPYEGTKTDPLNPSAHTNLQTFSHDHSVQILIFYPIDFSDPHPTDQIIGYGST